MAITNWNVDDGTKRTLFQNPSGIPFFTWPIAPNWRIVAGGQINQVINVDTSTTTLPILLFQGIRMYDLPVCWRPNFTYVEKPYSYEVPINFVANTVTAPGIIQKTLSQIINNYAFKLRRISFAYRAGPTNTAQPQQLGCRLFDWQNRQLMNDWVNTMVLDFNARDQFGAFVYGPHASFPAIPLLYPVNGQIRIDLTDMLAQASGSVSDIQGTILFEGANMVPCAKAHPGAVQPDNQDVHLFDGRVKYPLPYFYTPPMLNFTTNKATFTDSTRFSVAVDGDSDFWMNAIHFPSITSQGGPV